MVSSMNSLIFFNSLLLISNLLFCSVSVKIIDIQREILSMEALRENLNSRLLNESWVNLPCVDSFTSWIGLNCSDSRVVTIKLEGLDLSCQISDPFVLAYLTQLTYVSFKNNSISGSMFNFSFNIKIETIDLSMNQFSGPISNSLLYLNQLKSLQLHHNKLVGSIPPLNQTGLKFFNVSYNNLKGKIPNTSVLQSFDDSSYVGNSGLCGSPTPTPCRPLRSSDTTTNDKGSNMFSKQFIVMFIALDVIGVGLLLWTIFALCKRRRRGRIDIVKERSDSTYIYEDGDKAEKSEEIKIEETMSEERKKVVLFNGYEGFDLDELLKASAESLGTGSFGVVYKAILEDERALVVKRLRDVCPLTDEEFGNHIRGVASVRHPNLFPLLGFYCCKEERLLVYNFALNGNLYDRIHSGRGDSTRIPFKWNSRLSVAKHIARGLAFLHKTTKSPDTVPHANLKSSNILLESDGVALIADYGLLPLVPSALAPKRMAAYRAPEYHHTRKVWRKSDVWSFGFLLLELVTRKGPTSSKETDLVGWVNRAVREEWTCEVFDTEIGTHKGTMDGVFKLLQLALWCCERSMDKRPEMEEVVRVVESIMPPEKEEELIESV